jgi:hypothetical protein
MGSCCPKEEEPIIPANGEKKQRPAKQEKPLNVFKPGARDIRIVENEETGQL